MLREAVVLGDFYGAKAESDPTKTLRLIMNRKNLFLCVKMKTNAKR